MTGECFINDEFSGCGVVGGVTNSCECVEVLLEASTSSGSILEGVTTACRS